MPSKRLTAVVSVFAAWMLIASPVAAQGAQDALPVEAEETDVEFDADAKAEHDARKALDKAARAIAKRAAKQAQHAAAELEAPVDPEAYDKHVAKARKALEKAMGNAESSNGIADEVLTALLAGESPAKIGAAHGEAMAAAAKAHRAERKNKADRDPDDDDELTTEERAANAEQRDARKAAKAEERALRKAVRDAEKAARKAARDLDKAARKAAEVDG